MRRIFEGVRRYVLEAAEPFIVKANHTAAYYKCFRGQGLGEPLQTVTQSPGFSLVAPSLITNTSGHAPGAVRGPLPTITTGNHHALVSAWIAKHYTGVVGSDAREPLSTVTTTDHNALVSAHIQRDFGQSVGHGCDSPMGTVTGGGGGHAAVVSSHLSKLYGTAVGQDARRPMPTVTAGGNHVAEVRAFLTKYFGTAVGHDPREPLHTVTARQRFGLVTIQGEPWQIADIGMRMLSPRELFRAQGFCDDYVIDIEIDDRPITKAEQVRCAGNSVCPDMADALVRANVRAGVAA
jgi:DNA (cytosine-5)-methyltransferase 1